MTKKTYASKNPMFAAAGGGTIFDKFQYSSAVKAGGLVFVAGQIGLNAGGSIPEKPEQQFINAFERLKLVLEETGCEMTDLVELVSYHVGLSTHLAEFAKSKVSMSPTRSDVDHSRHRGPCSPGSDYRDQGGRGRKGLTTIRFSSVPISFESA